MKKITVSCVSNLLLNVYLMNYRLILCLLTILGLFLSPRANAVEPPSSDNWADFSGIIQNNVNNQYVSIIYDTDDDGLCEDADLTGATQVATSPKASWLAGGYFLENASISLGFAMPEPSYRERGLCLRYYSGGYKIEPANAFFYQATSPTPTPTATPPLLMSDIASNSQEPLVVYAYMTAGDIAIIIGLFGLVMLQLLWIFWRKI